MLKRFTLVAAVAFGAAAIGGGIFGVSHGGAKTLSSDSAYYLVVQHGQNGAGFSQTTIVSRGQNSMSVVQSGGGTSDVGCTRYASLEDAQTAAADRSPGETVQVVLATDAIHALAQSANASDDMLALLPQLDDADVCTP